MARRLQRRRKYGALLVALLTMLSVALFPACSRRNVAATFTGALPPQGLYEECPLIQGEVCRDRLKQMAGAGFQLIVNYDQLYGTANQELAYLQLAQSLGMKVIWNLSDPAFWNGSHIAHRYGALAAPCGCVDTAGFIRYVVGLAKNLPATWGYYVGDEVRNRDHTREKRFAESIRKLDPSHPMLYIANGNYAPDGSTVAPFADVAGVVGADYYPIGNERNSASLSKLGQLARATQAVANALRKQSAIVLQAFSFADYPEESSVCTPFPRCARYPTRDEMRRMRDMVLRNSHPQFILWYSYFDTMRSNGAAAHWADLIAAAGTRHASLVPPSR